MSKTTDFSCLFTLYSYAYKYDVFFGPRKLAKNYGVLDFNHEFDLWKSKITKNYVQWIMKRKWIHSGFNKISFVFLRCVMLFVFNILIIGAIEKILLL